MKHHIPYRDNPHLSKREKEVLSLLLEGQSEKQIALRLQITRFTVHTYVKQLHVKFDVASRGELLAVVYNQMLNASPAERPTTQAIEPTEEMSMPEATLATPPAASSTPAIPASSLRMAVLNKFPSFDPSWDAGCQRSWFRAYQMLLSVT